MLENSLQQKRNKNLTKIALFILSSLVLIPLTVRASSTAHQNANSCGAGPWYWAYNDYPGFEYQVVDYAPSARGDSMAIGGKTSKCQDLQDASLCPSQNGAFVMAYQGKTQAAPSSILVVGSVKVPGQSGVFLDVVGVLAIKASLDSDGSSALFFGVFEPADGRSLVFFNNKNNGVIELFATSEYNRQACNYKPEWFNMPAVMQRNSFYQDCDSKAVYYHKWFSNSESFFYKYDPSSNANSYELKPASLFQTPPDHLMHQFPLLIFTFEDSSGVECFLLQFANFYDNQINEDRSYVIPMDADFQQKFGAVFEIFDSGYVTSGQDSVLVLHQKGTRGKFMVWDRNQQSQTHSFFHYRVYEKVGAKFTIKSFVVQASQESGFMVLKDEANGAYMLLKDMKFRVDLTSASNMALFEITIQNRASNNSFDWLQRLSNILVDDSSALMGHSTSGSGFAFSGNGADQCLSLDLSALSSDTLSMIAEEIVDFDGTGVMFDGWSISNDYKFKYNGYSSSSAPWITEFAQPPQLNNPCKVSETTSYGFYSIPQKVSFDINPQSSFTDTCPDGSTPVNSRTIFHQISDSDTGEDLTNSNYFSVDPQHKRKIAVLDTAPIGKYTVSFSQGLEQATDQEIVQVQPDTFSVVVYDDSCVADPQVDQLVWSSPEYPKFKVVFDKTLKIDLGDITNGNCGYGFTEPKLVEESEADVFSQLTLSSDLEPDFIFQSGSNDRNVTGVNENAWIQLQAPSLTNDSKFGSFTMSVDCSFTGSLSTETIYFTVELDYCAAQLTPASNEVIKLAHETDAQDTAQYSFSQSNTATTCSKSQISVTDANGGVPDTDIFTISVSESKIDVIVNSQLAQEKAGVYELVLREEDSADPSKFVESKLEVTVVEIFDCTEASFTETSITSDYKYLIGDGQALEIKVTGITNGNCKFDSEFTFQCDSCDSDDSDTVKNFLTASTAQEQFQANDPQYKQFSVSDPAKVSLDASVPSEAIGFYSIMYQAQAPDGSGGTKSYPKTLQLHITDNPCESDPVIDPAVWSPTEPYTVLEMHFGSVQRFELGGITNGNCAYTVGQGLTSTLSSDFKKQFTVTEFLVPNFTFKSGSNDKIVEGPPQQLAYWQFDVKSIRESQVMDSFIVSNEITFPNSKIKRTIQFEIKLTHCPCVWPEPQTESLIVEQLTNASDQVTLNFTAQNEAIDCSLTNLKIIDKDTQIEPDAEIFDVQTSENGSQIQLSVKDSLKEATAGTYNLQVVETNSHDETDSYINNLIVKVIPECQLCLVKARSQMQVSELDQDSMQVLVSWSKPLMSPIESDSGLKPSQTNCDEHCAPTLSGLSFTTALVEAQSTKVTYDENARTATFQLPLNMDLEKSTNVTFTLEVVETVDQFNSAVLTEEFTVERQVTIIEKKEYDPFIPDWSHLEEQKDEKSDNSFIPDFAEASTSNGNEGNNTSEDTDVDDVFLWTPPIPKDWNYFLDPQSPPLVVISATVNQTGMLQIYFNKPVFTPSKYFNLTRSRLEQPDFDDQIMEVLALAVVSSYYDDDSPEVAISNYTLVEFTESGFYVQLDFYDYQKITTSLTEQDVLEVDFTFSSLFTDKIDFSGLANGTVVNVRLPPQMTMDEWLDLVELKEKVEGPMTIFSIIQLSSNIVLAYGLKYLWNMVNILQFLVFFENWKINIHPTAMMIITQIRKLALFEFLDTKFLIDWIKSALGIPSDDIEALRDKREYCDLEKVKDCTDLRFLQRNNSEQKQTSIQSADSDMDRLGSANLLDNFGIMLFFLVLLLLVVIVVMVLSLTLRKNKKVMQIVQRVKDKLFWNTFIRFVIQSTLKMQLSAGASLVLIVYGQQVNQRVAQEKDTDESEQEKSTLSKVLPSLIILAFFNLMPIVFICVLKNKYLREKLDDEKVKGKIGTLYATVDPKEEGSLWYQTVFMVRRSFYVLLTFTLFNQPGIQIQTFIYTTLLYLIYIHHWPKYREALTLKVETLNEVIFLVVCYCCVLFTNLIWNPSLKQHIGLVIIFCVFLLLGSNTCIIVWVSVQSMLRNARLKYLAKVREAYINERELTLGMLFFAKDLNANMYEKQDPQQFAACNQVFSQESDLINKRFLKKIAKILVDDRRKRERSLKSRLCGSSKSTYDEFYDAIENLKETHPAFFEDWNRFKPHLGMTRRRNQKPMVSTSAVVVIENTFDDDEEDTQRNTGFRTQSSASEKGKVWSDNENLTSESKQYTKARKLLSTRDRGEEEEDAFCLTSWSNINISPVSTPKASPPSTPEEKPREYSRFKHPKKNIKLEISSINDSMVLSSDDENSLSHRQRQRVLLTCKSAFDRKRKVKKEVVAPIPAPLLVVEPVDENGLTDQQKLLANKLLHASVELQYGSQMIVGSKLLKRKLKNPLANFKQYLQEQISQLDKDQKQEISRGDDDLEKQVD